jgi:hypothetical protein
VEEKYEKSEKDFKINVYKEAYDLEYFPLDEFFPSLYKNINETAYYKTLELLYENRSLGGSVYLKNQLSAGFVHSSLVEQLIGELIQGNIKLVESIPWEEKHGIEEIKSILEDYYKGEKEKEKELGFKGVYSREDVDEKSDNEQVDSSVSEKEKAA